MGIIKHKLQWWYHSLLSYNIDNGCNITTIMTIDNRLSASWANMHNARTPLHNWMIRTH